MNGDIEGKIDRARQIADILEDPNADLVRGWDARLDEIRIGEDFMKFPEVQKLKEFILGEIASINYNLQEREDLSDKDRTKLFALRSAHQVYLNKFSFDGKKERDALERDINFATRSSE